MVRAAAGNDAVIGSEIYAEGGQVHVRQSALDDTLTAETLEECLVFAAASCHGCCLCFACFLELFLASLIT